MPEPVRVNDLLREIPQLIAEIEVLEARRARQRTQIKRMEGRLNQMTSEIIPKSARIEALTRAADLLNGDGFNTDWREWEWVKEAGFADKVPSRERRGM